MTPQQIKNEVEKGKKINSQPFQKDKQDADGDCKPLTNLAYQIVEIEWFDAQSGFSSPLTLEELEREEPLHSFSVGYLLKEDKEKVILGFMMFGNEGMFKHWQLIPRGMIKRINNYRRKND